MTTARQDYMGLPLTTGSAGAAAAVSAAVLSYNGMTAAMMRHIKTALAADPDMPAAHAVRGLALYGARHAKFQPLIDRSLAAARAGIDAVSRRERLLIEALEQAAAWQSRAVVAVLERLITDHPTDAFAQRLAQMDLFRLGDAATMVRLAETGAAAWGHDTPARATWLGVRAFAHEEALDFAAAERYGREAVDRDPAEAWATHAVAHVLVMQGRIDDGIAWLERLSDQWGELNPFVHHLWWHLCLFLLERGAHDRILELYDSKVWNLDSPMVRAIPDHYVDLENAASLLLRLELRGVDVGARWSGLLGQADARLDSHVCPFTSAHAAIVYAAAGLFDRAAVLLDNMAAYGAGHDNPQAEAMTRVAVPAAQAAIAHRKGDWNVVAAALMPARAALPALGGSHAQRDVFYQILVDALRHLGRSRDLAVVMAELDAIGLSAPHQRTFYATVA